MRKTIFSLVLALGLFAGLNAHGQADAVLLHSSDTSTSGATVSIAYTLDSSADISGISFGACHTGGMTIVAVVAINDGADLAATNDGDGPDFNATQILPDGFTCGIAINFTDPVCLPGGMGVSVYDVDYALMGNPGDISTLTYCGTLGTPTVAISVVDCSGVEANVDSSDTGQIEIVLAPSTFAFIPPQGDIPYDPVTGQATPTDLGLRVADTLQSGGPTEGLSISSVHTAPAVLTAAEPTGVLAAVNDGDGPDFFGANIAPVGGPGFTVGIVYNLTQDVTISFSAGGDDVIAMTFDSDGSLVGNDVGAIAATGFADIGMPVVVNTIVTGAGSPPVLFEAGEIHFIVPSHGFVRGDCNDDDQVDIADGIYVLNFLFQGGPEGPCQAACDANSDGGVDQSDAIYIFNYRFLGGAAPASPFPECGVAGEPEDCLEGC